MNNCSIIDRTTNEPKVVYKPDNGEYTTDYVQALKNSATRTEIGYMQNGEFKQVAIIPKYSLETQEGITQHLIEHELLKPIQKSKDTYEAFDELSAEFIEDIFINQREGIGYIREGLDFTIPKQRPVEKVMEIDTEDLSFEQLTSKYGKFLGTRMFANKLFNNLLTKDKKKPIHFSEYTLLNKIDVFMKQMGISTTSIEEYKKKYKVKNGVEPDAKALININERIIAFVDGQITLSELTEEVSHFIVEGLNQDDVNAILPYTTQTSYYEKYADIYREAYEKQVGKELSEHYVQKEVLGKMLADYLQKDFDISTKNEAETNIFSRLGHLLTRFLNFLKGKITPSKISQINTMFADIENRLYNEKLNEDLNFNNEIYIREMYSMDTNPKIKKLAKFVISTQNKMQSSRKTETSINSADDIEVLKAVIQLLNDIDKRVKINIKRVTEANEKEENLDGSVFSDSTQVLGLRDNLESVLGVVASYKSDIESKEFKQEIIQIGNDISKNMSDLNKAVSSNNSVQEQSTEELMQDMGFSQTRIDQVNRQLEKKRSDLSWWLKNMGNISKSDNPLIALFSTIVDRVFNMAHYKTQNDLETSLRSLGEENSIDEINSIIDGNYFVSEIDKSLLQKDKDMFDYNLRKKLNMIEKDMTFDEFLESDEKLKTLSPGNNNLTYYVYQWEMKKAISEPNSKMDWYSESYKKYIKDEMSKYEKLGITSGSHPLFKFLTNQADTRRKYSTSESSKKEIGAINYRDRKEQMNIFDSYGNVKEGLRFERISKFEQLGIKDYVELSNKKGWGVSLVDVFTLSDERVAEDAELTFTLLKWTQEFEKLDEDTLTTIKNNYRKDFSNKLNDIKNLPEKERIKELLNWITSNTQFTMNDDYWKKLENDISGIELLKRQTLTITEQDLLAKVERELVSLELRRKVILDKTKDPSDSKEIDSTLLTEQDKDEIRRIEESIYEQRKQLEPLFADKEIPMYSDRDSNPVYNKSFYREYERIMGTQYNPNKVYEVEAFFDKIASTSKKIGLRKLKDSLGKGKSSDIIKDLRKRINKKDSEITNEDVILAYMENNSPIYYKRYDSDVAYSEMINDFRIGAVSEQSLIDFVNNSIISGKVVYKGKSINNMEFSPNFRFATQADERASDLFQEYLENKANYKTELEKYNALRKVLKIDNVSDKYKRDFSEWLNNPKKLKMYNTILEFRMQKMNESGVLNKFDILLRPQFRKSETERKITFFTKGDKINQVKEAVEEVIKFRADDENDSYVTQSVPLYGYRKISEKDITNDMLASLARFSYESNLYVERKKNLNASNSIMNKVFEQTYGNKTGYDSNYYKMLKELQQVHFFGRRLTAEAKVNIFGKEMDIAKTAVFLKNSALGVSLKLSPVVALTNATTGITTLQMMKWVGDAVYTPSDDRAMSQLGSMVSGGVSEVGALFASNRLNKIGENFGVFSGLNRLRDTNYGKTGRILPNLGYGLMEATNYPLATRVLMNKLMEMRVIDGKIYTWASYRSYNMINFSDKSQDIIKSEFEDAKNNSLWDLLDANGKLDYDKLKALGVTETLENIQLDAMAKIRDVVEEVTGQLGNVSNPLANYNPWAQFVMSLKKWMVIATTNVFSNNRYDINREGNVQGLYLSPRAMWDMLQDMRKNHASIKEAWGNLTPEERTSVKNISVTGFTLLGLMILASATMKYADDDDEKDNYLAQLTAYMTLRTLNEASSASFGLLDNYYQALQNPVQTLQILKDGSNLLNVGDVGETLQTGKFKGWNKYGATLIKLTPYKNIQTISTPYTLETSRKGYLHFGTEGSIYNILNGLPKTNRNE